MNGYRSEFVISGCFRASFRLRLLFPNPFDQTKTAGFPPPFGLLLLDLRSAEQLEHALLRLVGERQRGDC
ncbi:hypothetical protein, partial [Bradyrhizobium sp.]|uniref:hypothetical protein n=1 Tax=Bradyrhizobium sp. TaxID=376 RepID=UPI003C1793D8